MYQNSRSQDNLRNVFTEMKKTVMIMLRRQVFYYSCMYLRQKY